MLKMMPNEMTDDEHIAEISGYQALVHDVSEGFTDYENNYKNKRISDVFHYYALKQAERKSQLINKLQ